METGVQVSTSSISQAPTNGGFIRQLAQLSPPTLHILEARPSGSVDRCFLATLDRRNALLIPTNSLDFENPAQDSVGTDTQGHAHRTLLAKPVILPAINVNEPTGSRIDFISPGPSDMPHNGPSSSIRTTLKTNLFLNRRVGEHLRPDLGATHDQLSAQSLHLLDNAVKPSTQRHYFYAINKWQLYCESKGFNYKDTTLFNIVNYLVLCYDSGLTYSTVNGIRSAISSCHKKIQGVSVGQSELVCKTLNGIKNLHPPQPRYATAWNIDKVLNLFEEVSWGHNLIMPLSKLAKKTIMLIITCTACRISVLTRLTIPLVIDLGDRYKLIPTGYDKTGSFSQPAQALFISKFSEECICPYRALKAYLARRPKVASDKIFISLSKGAPASQFELSNWLSEIMRLSGVPDNFRPHSIRGAVTSKAQGLLPTEVILEAANWASYDTFRKFYFKPIEDGSIATQRDSFQRAILD